jgi:hypothetical protein
MSVTFESYENTIVTGSENKLSCLVVERIYFGPFIFSDKVFASLSFSLSLLSLFLSLSTFPRPGLQVCLFAPTALKVCLLGCSVAAAAERPSQPASQQTRLKTIYSDP